ncbi:MAG: hypothetical protein OXG72_20975 [Acidobacteria bacterium]|nr:hypothetical protein [Acidobacteriota bacterium]
MTSHNADVRRDVRYEPDDKPSHPLSLGLGLQYAMVAVPSIVLGPTIMITAAGGGDAYLSWAVCWALAISGITTAIQAIRIGRVGAGYVLLMGTSNAFLAISVAALERGGPVVDAAAYLHPDRGRHRADADPRKPGPGDPGEARRCAARAIDFRSVQGAMWADGVGNLLSGLAGTLPNTTYATGTGIVELTGVAARSVGAAIGLVFVTMAFLPKFMAAIIAIPGPVVAAYYVLLVSLLFIFGIKILQHDGLDSRKGLMVGLAFWIGLAFELDWIFPEYFQGPWSELLGNGVTVGGLTVIALTLFDELTGSRRQRLRVALGVDAYPGMDGFLAQLGARRRWSDEMIERVRAVGEETLLLIRREEERTASDERRLLLIARGEGDAAVLEVIAATDETNLEDQMALLSDRAMSGLLEQEVSLRLLRHYASSVRHNKYHDTDVITVRVEPADAVVK